MRAVICCLVVILVHNAVARIFSDCDLVRDLRKHNVPEGDMPTWVCIAHGESSMDSTARGPPNYDSSRDNGIFQINDRYWCSNGRVGGDCYADCQAFRDDNITDDIICALLIKNVQGFEAWVTYKNCRSNLPDVSKC